MNFLECHKKNNSFMVLAGIEFIFFVEACVMLCFGFLVKNSHENKPMVLVVVEKSLHRAMDFSPPHAALPVGKLRVHQKLGEDTVRTPDPD